MGTTGLKTTISEGDLEIDPSKDMLSIYKVPRDSDLKHEDTVPVLDSDWVSNSFMVKTMDIEEKYQMDRFRSPVDEKFTDTTLGGNFSINVSPQFTRYADVRSGGILSGRKEVSVASIETSPGKLGMGRFYGEVHDDNSTNAYLEFGIFKFNNTLFYLLSSVDFQQAVIANSGRSSYAFTAGKAFGTLALFLAFPIITVSVLLVKTALNFATNMLASPGRFDHFYLKPVMFRYWATVNTLVSMMSTELGILSPLWDNDKKKADKIGAPLKLEQEDLDSIREMMPGLITTHNAINVHAMVARGQIMYNKNRENRLKALDKMSKLNLSKPEEYELYRTGVEKIQPVVPNDLWETLKEPINADKMFKDDGFIKDLQKIKDDLVGKTKDTLENALAQNKEGQVPKDVRPEDSESWLTNSMTTAKSVYNEGARYAVFRVEHFGSISETFSNSTTTVGLDDKINSMGKTYRDLKFNIGGGEVPGVSTLVKGIFEFGMGAVDGLTMGVSNVVAGFLAGATIETDKRWDGSTASLPNTTYKIPLRSPSAHPIAQLQNLYIPLASILAGVLPLSTGHKSYTSPFGCSMFIRGKQTINRGMITNVTVTRGVSSLPYNKQRRPLAIDVTFTVTDFSEIVSAPTASDLLDSGSTMFDDESGINRYIQSLCGRDLFSTTHIFDKGKIKFARWAQAHELVWTSEYWGSKIGDTAVSTGIVNWFSDSNKVNYSELY